MSALLRQLAGNPTASAALLGASASLADAGRRGAVTLLTKLCDLPRRRTAGARARTAAAHARPWREPGYGLARALSETENAAGRARLAAAIEHHQREQ
jgi:hypothetical protein